MTLFTGSGVAIVTPMTSDGKVDFENLRKLFDWHIENKTDAIIACGTTGEASTLDDDEHIAVIEAVVQQAAGRVPVIGGVGSNNTLHAVELSVKAENVGADGLLHVTPYYNKASKKGLLAHYKLISENVNIPIILYSVASRTGMNLTPEMVSELKELPHIVGIKEASGDISQIVEIARLADEDFAIYSGNDDQILPVLSVGGAGVISTVANIIPQQLHDMIAAYQSGDIKTATKIQLDYKPLMDAVFAEVNPIPIKAAVSMIHEIPLNYRLPLCEPEKSTSDRLAELITEYDL